jgi:tRNA(adenine34) deaminase
LRNVVLVVQDWGGLLGLTLADGGAAALPRAAGDEHHAGTGDAPLSPGFLAWREMCARNPDFDVARLFARGNPQMAAAECAAYNAPFPDRGHRAALRAFPPMVPEFPDRTAPRCRGRRATSGASAGGPQPDGDRRAGPGARPAGDAGLRADIRGCPEPMVLEQAGHFVQEHGEPIARRAVGYFRP